MDPHSLRGWDDNPCSSAEKNHSHLAGKWQSQKSTPGCLSPEPMHLPTQLLQEQVMGRQGG